MAANIPREGNLPAGDMLAVTAFLPKGFVTDGSVSYQTEIQRDIDAAAGTGRTLVFPKMVCRLDESGLQIRSHLTLWMYGAQFQMHKDRKKKGQAFIGKDVENVQFLGGEIAGRNDVWPG